MNTKTVNSRLVGKRCQGLRFALSVLCLGLAQQSTWAHSPNDSNPNSLATKIRQSALIAYGQVVDIQYRNSESTRAQPSGVPHTFVTYQVQDILRGDLPGKTVTLRIPGGADGQGGVFMETSAPVFALGQTDMLFVKGGDIVDCQLVDCAEGRFRVNKNQVFNGWGVPVVGASKGLQIGGKPRFDLNIMELPTPPFKMLLQRADLKADLERIMKETGLTLDELEAKYGQEAPKSNIIKLGFQNIPFNRDVAEESKALPMKKYGLPLTLEAFSDAVRTLSKQIGPPTTKFVMADANNKFIVRDPKALAMKLAVPPNLDISEEERLDAIKTGGLQ